MLGFMRVCDFDLSSCKSNLSETLKLKLSFILLSFFQPSTTVATAAEVSLEPLPFLLPVRGAADRVTTSFGMAL